MTNTVPWALSHTQIVVEVVATIAFALSGVIEGARKRLDAVGDLFPPVLKTKQKLP